MGIREDAARLSAALADEMTTKSAAARRWLTPAATLLTLFVPGAGHASLHVPQEAYAEGAIAAGEPRVEARLLADAAAVTPGESFRVGVLFTMDAGWHIYWRNPGQAALATELTWKSDALDLGPVQWPAPAVFRQSGEALTTYGYAGEVLLFARAVVRDDARGAAEVEVVANYLACNVDCTPGQAVLRRKIAIQDAAAPASDAVVARFDGAAMQVPLAPDLLGVDVEVAYNASAVRPNDAFGAALAVVACHAPPTEDAPCPTMQLSGASLDEAVVLDRLDGLELRPVASRAHPAAYSGLVIDLLGRADASDPGADQRLRGVLKLERDDGRPAFVQIDVPLPRARAGADVRATSSPLLVGVRAAPASEPAAAPSLGLLHALLLALVGGLLLNLMPCVLPVLALKVVGIAHLAHVARRRRLMHGLAYGGGVVLTMLALAAAVAVLKAAGHAAGWGFQFQEPLFVTAVSCVLVLFALNLFGVFEIYVGAHGLGRLASRSEGLVRSGLEGVLAVVLATPCSAPFLGTAVGFALASETSTIAAVFAAVGVGLAAPFVLLSVAPGLGRFVPRPGDWMIRLKQLLGFALLATVVWLLWLRGRSADVDAMAGLLAVLLTVALAAWAYGAVQLRARPWRLGVLAGSSLIVALALHLGPGGGETAGAHEEPAIAWSRFEPRAVASALREGRLVFIDFTADWCITCKVNERTVLADAAVRERLRELGVLLLKADWTRRDEVIRAELERFGKAGVPMYLLYSPKAPSAPVILPELLTVDVMLEALARAATGTRG